MKCVDRDRLLQNHQDSVLIYGIATRYMREQMAVCTYTELRALLRETERAWQGAIESQGKFVEHIRAHRCLSIRV